MTERIWRSTRRRPIEDRLTEKIDRRGPDDCWPWRAAAANDMGHGQISYQRRPVKAHRVAFMLAYGYLPPVVRHKCDNPPCCNPAHLFAGTNAENTADRDAKGRQIAGERHPSARLTADNVREMRRLHSAGVGYKRLAATFGVSVQVAKRAAIGQSWRSVTD